MSQEPEAGEATDEKRKGSWNWRFAHHRVFVYTHADAVRPIVVVVRSRQTNKPETIRYAEEQSGCACRSNKCLEDAGTGLTVANVKDLSDIR
jgi:hypothetical protein